MGVTGPSFVLSLHTSTHPTFLPRLTFFTHFTLSIHAVGGSERSERFTFPSGRLRRVKREGVNDRRAGSVPRRRPAATSEETAKRGVAIGVRNERRHRANQRSEG